MFDATVKCLFAISWVTGFDLNNCKALIYGDLLPTQVLPQFCALVCGLSMICVIYAHWLGRVSLKHFLLM